MKRCRYGDDVNGDVAKTGDTSSLHYRFSAVIKALIAQHEQGFKPLFNYDLRKCVTAFCISMIIYHLLSSLLRLFYPCFFVHKTRIFCFCIFFRMFAITMTISYLSVFFFLKVVHIYLQTLFHLSSSVKSIRVYLVDKVTFCCGIQFIL